VPAHAIAEGAAAVSAFYPDMPDVAAVDAAADALAALTASCRTTKEAKSSSPASIASRSRTVNLTGRRPQPLPSDRI
jgi:hypothetical protein